MAILNPTMPKQKRATIYEVARLAGVSHVTVTRAFSDVASISDATRKKVQAAVRRLDYQPNPLARGLNGASTRTISIVWPMGYTFVSEKAVADLVTKFQNRGYHAQMGSTLNSIDMVKEMLKNLQQRSVDAVVLNITPETLDNEIIEMLKSFRAAVVITTEPLNIAVDQIVWSRASAINEAVSYFVKSGRKNIAHCGLARPEEGKSQMREQYKADAFLNSLRDNGIKCSQENLITFDYISESYNIEFMQRSLEAMLCKGKFPFDAVLCINDWLAVVLSQMLTRHGFKIPDDVAVIGYDDSHITTLFDPPIASVNRCNEAMVDAIEQTVFERLKDRGLPVQKKEVCMKVVYRASAG
ncbi:MAG: LacI family DNA-binding transcriptional regulator [Sedimentisphaerales bacterium]